MLRDALTYLPPGVKKVSLRSDTASYQEELLLYCGEGKDKRFGVIAFASALTAYGSIGPLRGPIGADVTAAFRAAVRATAPGAWKKLTRTVGGVVQPTDQA